MSKVERAIQSAFQKSAFSNRLSLHNSNYSSVGPKLQIEQKRNLEISLNCMDNIEIDRNFQMAPDKMIKWIDDVTLKNKDAKKK